MITSACSILSSRKINKDIKTSFTYSPAYFLIRWLRIGSTGEVVPVQGAVDRSHLYAHCRLPIIKNELRLFVSWSLSANISYSHDRVHVLIS